jgi:uncharacterized protein YjiS (DUF1127 family)
MTATQPYPVLNEMIDVFASWLKHRREVRELRDLDSREFLHIAHDLRVTPSDLERFVRQGPHASDELPSMLKALGIDAKALARAQPMVLRDMTLVCAACQQKRRCNADLAAGTSGGRYRDYCSNAPTIDALG